MNVNCIAEVKGHIIDSLTLTKIMDRILDLGAECRVEEIKVGAQKNSVSYARLNISAISKEILDRVVAEISKHGAVIVPEENKITREIVE